jgi:hypothetical protein
VLAGVVLGVGVLVTPAAADAAEHCVKNLDTGVQQCYSTFAEVQGLQAKRTNGVQAVYILATFYEWYNLNPGGGTFTVSRDRPCTVPTDKADHGDPVLEDEGWNDRISSFETSSNCDLIFYLDIHYKYSCWPTYRDVGRNLGSCDNRASSWLMS